MKGHVPSEASLLQLLGEGNRRLRAIENKLCCIQAPTSISVGTALSSTNGGVVTIPANVKSFTIYNLGKTGISPVVYEDITLTGGISQTLPSSLGNTPITINSQNNHTFINKTAIVVTPSSLSKVFVTYTY